MSETPACWSALSRDGAREYGVGFMSINSMSTVSATPTCVSLTMSSRGAVSAVEAASVSRRHGHGRETRCPRTQTLRRRASKLSETSHHAPVKGKTRSNFRTTSRLLAGVDRLDLSSREAPAISSRRHGGARSLAEAAPEHADCRKRKVRLPSWTRPRPRRNSRSCAEASPRSTARSARGRRYACKSG